MEDKSNFRFLYNMCMKAHATATNHLQALANLLSQDSVMVENLPTEPVLYLEAYNEAFSRLSAATDVIRKFNMQVQLSDLVTPNDLYSKTTSQTLQHVAGNQNEATNIEPIFQVNLPNLGVYQIGCSSRAIVSHVKCVDQQLFYIIDETRFSCDLTVQMSNFFDIPRKSMTSCPQPGVVVGLLDDGTLLRVVVENNAKMNSNSFRVYFIDLGEIITVINDCSLFYELPTNLQTVPPQAILCKLHKLTKDEENNEAPMQYLLDKSIIFKVLKIYNGVVVVDVSVAPIPTSTNQLGLAESQPLALNSTNPFCMDLLRNNIETLETNESAESTVSGVTEEERQQLFEETGCTDNAMVAVMGHDPQDDRRICQFYDPQTGGCFKGSSCRKEHVAKLKDGWTRDRILSKANTRIDMPYPKRGSSLKVIPTHVSGTRLFYVHLINNANNLKEINFKINSNEYLNSYKPLLRMPSPLELVLAKYIDGYTYRAQVREITDKGEILVYYVDYGDIRVVNLADLRLWDDRFDFLPFQAYPCRLDNVVSNDNPKAAELFRELILHRELNAHVHFSREELFLTLTDEEGFDVGESLCSMGLAEFIPNAQRNVLHEKHHH